MGGSLPWPLESPVAAAAHQRQPEVTRTPRNTEARTAKFFALRPTRLRKVSRTPRSAKPVRTRRQASLKGRVESVAGLKWGAVGRNEAQQEGVRTCCSGCTTQQISTNSNVLLEE